SFESRKKNSQCEALSLSGFALQTPFGLIRIALVVVPFLYVGTQISKSFAALLEEHDIFVPEDDDDDD
uniref:Essential MCU regulator, mitochondrial n=1 Tax=Mola mola TaxID=94237 RepID=A0A3Q3WCC0_MOLML